MEFSEKMKAARIKKGMTQEQVAQALYVSRQAVSHWESGKNYPDLESLCLLSDLYQISLDTLLKGDKKMIEKITERIEGNVLKKYLGIIIWVAGIIGMGTCGIVDLALNHTFTWTPFVFVSVLYLEVILQILMSSRKQSVRKIGIAMTIITPLLLISIQYSLVRLNPALPIWIWNIGLPIAAIWIVLFWVGYVIQLQKKYNVYLLIALISGLSIIGNVLTNFLIYRITHDYEVNVINAIIVTMVLATIGITCMTKGMEKTKHEVEN